MARSTGPILAAGAITWTNNVLLAEDPPPDLFTSSIKIALATSLSAMLLNSLELLFGDLASALAYAALTTVLFVRIGSNPTPLERAISLIGG